MERTTTMIIFIGFAIVGAAMIFLFISQWRASILHNPLSCPPEPKCASNGQTFCNDDGTLSLCRTDERGCLQRTVQQCTCMEGKSGAVCQ